MKSDTNISTESSSSSLKNLAQIEPVKNELRDIFLTPHLTDQQMADRLGFSIRDFQDRIKTLGIPHLVIGTRRRYPLHEVLAWEQANTIYPEKIRSAVRTARTNNQFRELISSIVKDKQPATKVTKGGNKVHNNTGAK